MRVPVQIIIFSCFLFFVTVVRGQEVTCELKSKRFGVNKINPERKTLFRAGESVEITCAERYWIFGTKETIRSFTCQENGEWDHEPVCEDIRCEVPRDQHVYNPHSYFRGDMKWGATTIYYCMPGYKEKMATCTQDGWTPKPLCAGMCAAPNIRNAEIVGDQRPNYNINSRIEYKCRPGFEPEQPVEITCNSQTEWTGIQQCTDIRCEVPRDQHVYNPHSYFRGDMKWGATIIYYCMPGYERKVATCTQDGWTPKPLCAGKMCAAPNIPNAEIVGDQRPNYNINSRIEYKCRPGFEPEQLVEITCNSQTEWTGIRQCTAKQKLCPDLSVENGLIHTLSSNEEEIFYSCNTGYKPFSGNWWDSVTCSKGSWTEEPRCIREEECGAFPSVHHGKLKKTKKIFRNGDTTAFECDPGFIPTQSFIKCVSGTWETPVCEAHGHCGIPPKVENALITSKPEEFYGDGSSVTYVCRSSFLMNGKSTVFCRSGTWEETPTCKEVMCVANLTVNMRSHGHPGPKVSIRPGHTITLSCVGRELKLQGHSKITCLSNGEWNVPFPKCVGGKCGPPPHVNFADTIEMTKEYDSGERVEYSCFIKYTLAESHPYSKYLTCDQGE